MAVKKVSRKGKGSYAVYKNADRAKTNKIASLERHLKKFPNDVTAAGRLAQLKKPGTEYTGRKAPKRNRANMIHFGTQSATANKFDGRLSYTGKLIKGFLKVAKKVVNARNHKPKEQRELEARIAAERQAKREAYEARKAKQAANAKPGKGKGKGKGKVKVAKGAK
ncbi:hypothetical protein EniLVp02_0039 [Vibrio phage EniLVp02]